MVVSLVLPPHGRAVLSGSQLRSRVSLAGARLCAVLRSGWHAAVVLRLRCMSSLMGETRWV